MPTFYLPIFYRLCTRRIAAVALALSLAISLASAQSVGNSGSVSGTVLDSTGAVVPDAKVELRNPVSGFDRSTTTDSAGKFAFTNIPFNPYHITVMAAGFRVDESGMRPCPAA